MKSIISYLMLMASMMMSAQKPLDTLYANDHMNVALFFPKPIRQAITGAENFAFTYNREHAQYLGLLQATPGDASNLLAITVDGNVYQYLLKYSKAVTKLHYFIKADDRIGHEMPEDLTSIKISDTLLQDKDASYEPFSEWLLNLKQDPMGRVRKKGMVLELLNMVYHNQEVYMVMKISNRSGIDFELDYLNISLVRGHKRHQASYQKLEQPVLYQHKAPRLIGDKTSHRFVFVLPKMVLGEADTWHIEAKEWHGGRYLTLKTKN